jgi:hypothetical protein
VQSEGPHNDEGGTEAAENGKVVPFPRDWIGPREELIPFGPGARRAEADEPDAPSRAASTSTPRQAGSAFPPSPNDFWSEGAAAMHDALQVPDPVWAEPQPSGSAWRTDAIGALRRPHRSGLAAAVVAGAFALVAAVAVLPRLGGTQGVRRTATTSTASRGTGSFLAGIRTRPIIEALRQVPRRFAAHRSALPKPRRHQAPVPATASSSAGTSVTADSYNPSTYTPTYVRSTGAAATGSGSGSSGPGSGSGSGSGSSGSSASSTPAASTASAGPAGPVGPGAPFGPGHLG